MTEFLVRKILTPLLLLLPLYSKLSPPTDSFAHPSTKPPPTTRPTTALERKTTPHSRTTPTTRPATTRRIRPPKIRRKSHQKAKSSPPSTKALPQTDSQPRLAPQPPTFKPRPTSGKDSSQRPELPEALKFSDQGKIGWLSLVFPPEVESWLDGIPTGRGVIPYLRIPSGEHRVKVRLKSGKELELKFSAEANRHTGVTLWRGYLRYYRIHRENSNVIIRNYRRGRSGREVVRPPGEFCPPKGRCTFLFPGEAAYISRSGELMILPSKAAEWNSTSFHWRRGDGSLSLYSFPPGALFFRGKVLAVTPFSGLPLSAGNYEFTVRNNFLGMKRRFRVTIRRGEKKRLAVFLVPSEGGSLSVVSERPRAIFVDGFFRGYTPLYSFPLPVGRHTLVAQDPDGGPGEDRYSLNIEKGRALFVTLGKKGVGYFYR